MRWNIWVASARLIKTRSICILIVGEGEKLIELKAYAQTEGLKNIVFLPKIVKAQVPSVMRKLDVCFIGWRVTKLYDYGISPNKIPEYLMSGKPVLHSFSGPNDPISLADAGVTVPAEDPAAIADAIESLEQSSLEERENMGMRGSQYAVRHYNYEKIAEKLAKEIMA